MTYSVASDGSLEFVNRALFENLGYTGSEVNALKPNDFPFSGYIKKHEDLMNSTLKGKRHQTIEFMLRSKNGELIYGEGNMFPRKERSQLVGVTGVFRNVTENKAVDPKLKEAKSRIGFFVNLMLHDLANINQKLHSWKIDPEQEVIENLDVTPLEHTPFLKIQIVDHGPGIPDLEKENEFSSFSHRRDNINGLGLGLALVKRILEKNNTTLRVEVCVEGNPYLDMTFVILLRHHIPLVTEGVIE